MEPRRSDLHHFHCCLRFLASVLRKPFDSVTILVTFMKHPLILITICFIEPIGGQRKMLNVIRVMMIIDRHKDGAGVAALTWLNIAYYCNKYVVFRHLVDLLFCWKAQEGMTKNDPLWCLRCSSSLKRFGWNSSGFQLTHENHLISIHFQCFQFEYSLIFTNFGLFHEDFWRQNS